MPPLDAIASMFCHYLASIAHIRPFINLDSMQAVHCSRISDKRAFFRLSAIVCKKEEARNQPFDHMRSGVQINREIKQNKHTPLAELSTHR
eukprot:5026049-Amphidinium_carterae.1